MFDIKFEEIYCVIENMEIVHSDFDEAYQYTLADRYGLCIISFDAGFDKTVKAVIVLLMSRFEIIILAILQFQWYMNIMMK